MISSIIDGVLLTALAATSTCVLLMYRRLQRFDALQNEAAKAFTRSASALDNARAAIGQLHEDGNDMVVALAHRLNEARLLINDLENANARQEGLNQEAMDAGSRLRPIIETAREAAERADAAIRALTAPRPVPAFGVEAAHDAMAAPADAAAATDPAAGGPFAPSPATTAVAAGAVAHALSVPAPAPAPAVADAPAPLSDGENALVSQRCGPAAAAQAPQSTSASASPAADAVAYADDELIAKPASATEPAAARIRRAATAGLAAAAKARAARDERTVALTEPGEPDGAELAAVARRAGARGKTIRPFALAEAKVDPADGARSAAAGVTNVNGAADGPLIAPEGTQAAAAAVASAGTTPASHRPANRVEAGPATDPAAPAPHAPAADAAPASAQSLHIAGTAAAGFAAIATPADAAAQPVALDFGAFGFSFGTLPDFTDTAPSPEFGFPNGNRGTLTPAA